VPRGRTTKAEFKEIESMMANRSSDVQFLIDKAIAAFLKENVHLDFTGQIWFDRVNHFNCYI
jgi:hypothetical protein